MSDDDFIKLVDEPEDGGTDAPGKAWKVAIIDDEPSVHEGTRLALSDYALNGQGLALLSAYSAAEGRKLLEDNPDIAVVLLDVINGDRSCRARPDRLYPRHAQARGVAYHPADGPAGPSAGAKGYRRLRHQ